MEQKNKGSSLYFAVVVIVVISGIALGVTTLLISQFEIAKGMGNSVTAIYVADIGIEQILYNIWVEGDDNNINGEVDFSEGVRGKYSVIVYKKGEEECQANHFCIESVGEYQEVKRAIEIQF